MHCVPCSLYDTVQLSSWGSVQAQHNGYANAGPIPDTPMSPVEERLGHSPHAHSMGRNPRSPSHMQGTATLMVTIQHLVFLAGEPDVQHLSQLSRNMHCLNKLLC